MRFHALIAVLAAVVPFAHAAYYKGFNIGANNPDGSCKTQDQWTKAFNKLRALPQGIATVRLYASSDCNTLANAVPAALSTATKILVGVWTEDAFHYNAEKEALKAAIQQHGHDWIIAISVGSEDLYRGDTSPDALAKQIYDVRGMVRAMGVQAPVGHVDTWTAWVNGANDAVTKACDFVGMDGYPYWQSSSITDAYAVFTRSYQDTINHVQSVKSAIPVWITETGWPYKGPSRGAAVASVGNARKFWRSVACGFFPRAHVFWYAYQDYTDSPAFGVFDRNGQALYDLSKC